MRVLLLCYDLRLILNLKTNSDGEFSGSSEWKPASRTFSLYDTQWESLMSWYKTYLFFSVSKDNVLFSSSAH